MSGRGKRYSDDSEIEGPEMPTFIAIVADPRRRPMEVPDPIYERLVEEAFNPDPLRSHVITLHLYVEYWLDRLLTLHNIVADLTFHKKTERLRELGVLEGDLYTNIVAINRLRNVYAHELNLDKATSKIKAELSKFRIDPRLNTNDKDPLRVVAVQTMFHLEHICANGGKPLDEDHPHEETRKLLLTDGRLHWAQCEILEKETAWGYVERYSLRCPLCLRGNIEREKDNTPGHKERFLGSCGVCGLTGDGTILILETAQPEFRGA